MPNSAKTSSETRKRVIIIGLDGATFDLFDPLMETGLLPHLSKLKSQSAHGTLWSTNPPTTPPAWTTFTTGVNPGRHGIYDFTESPLKNPRRPLVSSNSVESKRLWHYLQEQGHASVFVNVPITYPPEPINGCMISGMMTPDFNSPFTEPPDLRDRLKAVCGHYVPNIDIPQYDTTCQADAIKFIGDVSESMERRREAVRHLMDNEESTVFMAVFVGLDRILHLFAKYLFAGSALYNSKTALQLRPKLLDEIKRLDTIVGDMASRAAPQDTVMVMSDHGFGVTEGFFNANTWLMDLGYLAVKPAAYRRKRLFHTAHQIGDHPICRRLFPPKLQSVIRQQIRKSRSTMHSAKSDLESVIDWSRTKAFFGSIPSQGIYINEKTTENPDGIVEPSEVDELTAAIRSRLLELTVPDSSQKLADDVWFREDVFHGAETRFAPHVLFKMKNYSVLGRQHLGAPTYFTSAAHLPIGFHRSNGLVMIQNQYVHCGPMESSMVDLLPTILWNAGLNIPEGLDGKINTNLFQQEYLDENPIQYDASLNAGADAAEADGTSSEAPDYTDDDQQELEDRLRSLGYLE